MKKNYTEPTISLSFFSKDKVLTASAPETRTAAEYAREKATEIFQQEVYVVTL